MFGANNQRRKQVGYIAFPGLGHTVYLAREELDKLKTFPTNVLQLMVINSVAEVMNLTSAEIIAKTRKQPIPLARQLCMYSLCMDFGFSLKVVGKLMRPYKPYDHSTVVHGREVIKDALNPGDTSEFGEYVRELYGNLNIKLKSYINESNSSHR